MTKDKDDNTVVDSSNNSNSNNNINIIQTNQDSPTGRVKQLVSDIEAKGRESRATTPTNISRQNSFNYNNNKSNNTDNNIQHNDIRNDNADNTAIDNSTTQTDINNHNHSNNTVNNNNSSSSNIIATNNDNNNSSLGNVDTDSGSDINNVNKSNNSSNVTSNVSSTQQNVNNHNNHVQQSNQTNNAYNTVQHDNNLDVHHTGNTNDNISRNTNVSSTTDNSKSTTVYPTVDITQLKQYIDKILNNQYDKINIDSNTLNNDNSIDDKHNERRCIKYVFQLLRYNALHNNDIDNNNISQHELVNILKTINITSRRLLFHTHKQLIQHEIVVTISDILTHDIKIHKTSNSTSIECDTLIQQLISAISGPDTTHDTSSIIILQNILLLLSQLTVQLKNKHITQKVLPALISRFSNSTRFLTLIVDSLAQLAVDIWFYNNDQYTIQRINSKIYNDNDVNNGIDNDNQSFKIRTLVENEFDSIIFLLLRAYTNAYSNNNSNKQQLVQHSSSSSTISASVNNNDTQLPTIQNINNNHNSSNTDVKQTSSVSDLYQLIQQRPTNIQINANNNSNNTTTLPLTKSNTHSSNNNTNTTQATKLTEHQLNELSNYSNTGLYNAIPQALSHIAFKLHNIDNARYRLLRRLIRYCNDSAINILQDNNKQSLLTNLLYTISILMSDNIRHDFKQQQKYNNKCNDTNSTDIHNLYSNITIYNNYNNNNITLHNTVYPYNIGIECFTNDEQNVKWFRRFWYLLSILGYTYSISNNDNKSMPTSKLYTIQQLQHCIEIIAKYSPVLIITSQLKPLNSELELALKRSALTYKHAQLCKNRLYNIIHNNSNLKHSINNLSSAKLLFLYSLYELEYIRCSSNSIYSIQCILYYSGDSILHDSDMSSIVDYICSILFARVVRTQFSYQPTIQQRIIMNIYVNQLLLSYCSRYQLQRKAADTYLTKLAEACNQIQYSTSYALLLSIYNTVKQSTNTTQPMSQLSHVNNNTNNSSLKQCSISGIDNTCVVLDLSEQKTDRYNICNKLELLITQWTNISLKYASNILNNIINQFWLLHVTNNTISVQQHYGLQYVLSILPGHMSLQLTQTVTTEQQYRFQHLTDNNNLHDNIDNTIHKLQSQQTELFTQLQSTTDILTVEQYAQCRYIMYTAASLLINNVKIQQQQQQQQCNTHHHKHRHQHQHLTHKQQQLLYNIIVLYPIILFNTSVMQQCIYVWNWLYSVDESLSILLIYNIYKTYHYTIDNKMGLFSKTRYNNNNIIDTDNDINNIILGLQGSNDNIDNGDLSYYNTQLYKNDLNIHRLILDCLLQQCTYSLYGMNRIIIHTLYNIVIYSLQQYNTHLVTTPHAFSCHIRLYKLSLLILHYANFIDYDLKQQLRFILYNTILHWYTQPAIWLTHRSQIEQDNDIQIIIDIYKLYQNEIIAIKQLHNECIQDNSKTGSKKLVEQETTTYILQCNLIQLLLCDDLTRIQLWCNINNNNINDIINNQKHIHKSDWRTYLETSWLYSPKLAIQLHQRYKHINYIKQQLCLLIQNNITLCYNLTDSITYLITEQSIKDNKFMSTLQQHITKFQPTSLTNAIILLLPPYNEYKFLSEYAVYTLKSHSSDSVVYYISQLVQLLRHDKYNILSEYVRVISRRSIIFSHYFIWIAQAELGTVNPVTDDNGKPKPLILNNYQNLIKSIVNEIITSFDSIERTLYNIEFKFFERVTSISGVLKPLPTKEQRKQLLQLKTVHAQVSNDSYNNNCYYCASCTIA